MAVDEDMENQTTLALPFAFCLWEFQPGFVGLSRAAVGLLSLAVQGLCWAQPGLSLQCLEPGAVWEQPWAPRECDPCSPAELGVSPAAAGFGAQGLVPATALSSFSSHPSAQHKSLIDLRFILIQLEICLKAFPSLDAFLKMKSNSW